nr:DUF1684 domain-containing protein [Bacteroidota bacterium]
MTKSGIILTICLFGLISILSAQIDNTGQTEKASAFQQELNEYFSNPETSPLTEEDREHFKILAFYPVNLNFAFRASFKLTPHEFPFMMQRTKDEVKYIKYGEATFEYKGKKHTLSVYQNLDLIAKNPDYKDHLFLPFTDLTNGKTTYGGGRYIDLTIPGGDWINIDFNQAYNPYCAYNKKYSCPIPPKENDLNIAVEAGVKAFGDH